MKDFSCDMVALDRTCSNIEDMTEGQVTILNQSYENELSNTNFYKHTSTCEKEAKGESIYRLFMAHSLKHEVVRPLMIYLKIKGNMVKKEKAILESHDLDDEMTKHVDAPVYYEK